MEWGFRTRTLGIATLALGAVAAVTVPTVLAGPGDTTLVSRESRAAGGQGADANSLEPDVSASGRFVAFRTNATNLGGPIQAPNNIYVYDRKRKRVELVSRQSRSAGGMGADFESFQPVISADGRFVAFRTGATNLGGPIQASSNIYVYDRKRDRVQLVSRQSRSTGGEGSDALNEDPAISGSGRFVSFQTTGDNLGGPLDDAEANIYVYDRKRKRVELVSRQSRSAGGDGQDASFLDDFPSHLSHSGRFVTWMTPATNLGGPIAPGGVTNIYVYDRERKRVQLVSRQSRSAGGQGADTGAGGGVLSASGRFVAFATGSNNLGGPISDVTNVYVYDRKRKRVTLVSRQSRSAGGDGGDLASFDPDISGSGRFIAMTSNSGNFGATATIENVWVYDRKRKRIRLVSRRSPGLGGDPAGDFSHNSAIAAGGRFIAFETNADNLGGPIDPAALVNVYIHQRRGR